MHDYIKVMKPQQCLTNSKMEKDEENKHVRIPILIFFK